MHLRTKIISAIMLFAFTFSTTGIVMNKHMCNGDVKNVTAYVKADHCDHKEVEVKDVPKCHDAIQNTQEDNCCENDTQELKNKEHYIAYNKVNSEQLAVLVAVVSAYSFAEIQSSNSEDYLFYESPPPISTRQSLHILHEKYLI